MILTQIGRFFPTTMGYFPPLKKCVIFSISQIGKHYKNVPNISQVFKLKTAYDWVEIYNYNITNWVSFSHIWGNFPNKEGEIPQYNLAHKPATLATQTTLML